MLRNAPLLHSISIQYDHSALEHWVEKSQLTAQSANISKSQGDALLNSFLNLLMAEQFFHQAKFFLLQYGLLWPQYRLSSEAYKPNLQSKKDDIKESWTRHMISMAQATLHIERSQSNFDDTMKSPADAQISLNGRAYVIAFKRSKAKVHVIKINENGYAMHVVDSGSEREVNLALSPHKINKALNIVLKDLHPTHLAHIEKNWSLIVDGYDGIEALRSSIDNVVPSLLVRSIHAPKILW